MALADFEVFIRERLRVWNEGLDLSQGSPVDAQVIQPLLRRIGTDPFTVDAATFIIERLTQEFPDLAASDGDATSDLLVKPALLLWDPIIREIQRVKSMLSFRDPNSLTTDEAEALGANLFSERNRGDTARGTGRIYFTQPQPQTITPANFFTSRGGLHFFPTGIHSIAAAEMLLNKEGDLYYFDIETTAENVGDQYNIGPGELATIANIAAAIRVTNKTRFRFGLPEEDAATFIGRSEQELTERSLVTLRGIVAKVGRAYPEITRLAVVGFNDPEMQRDVLSGGSFGEILLYGFDARVVGDGEYKPRTRRMSSITSDFIAALGPIGPVEGFILTIFNAFGPLASPKVRDIPITFVVNSTTIEIAEQVLYPTSDYSNFTIRRKELLISSIPGGIIIPDGPTGSISITPDEVHIGGCTDMLIRSADLDTSSLVIDVVSDDKPLLHGNTAHVISPQLVEIPDLILGVTYQLDDDTYRAINKAKELQYTFELLNSPVAGVYRVLDVAQVVGLSPTFTLDPLPLAISPLIFFRWRLISEITLDLVEPKETRISGTDGASIQNVDTFGTGSAIDFDAFGVSPKDILRISNGTVAGEYQILQVIAPGFTKVQVDRPFTATVTGLTYTIFRRNKAGGALRPLVRITSLDLLDTGGQPVGSKIPYAKPVDARSQTFSNSGTGVKVSVVDAQLGLVSQPAPPPVIPFNPPAFLFGGGGTLSITWDGLLAPINAVLAGDMPAINIVNAINGVSFAAVGLDIAAVVQYSNDYYVGIIPVGPNTRIHTASTGAVLTTLFGNTELRTSRDVRSVTVPNWNAISPTIDKDLDALMVIDGLGAGVYEDLLRSTPSPGAPITTSTALRVSHDFAPEFTRTALVGARSLGSARLYFLAPTSMEVDQDTVFTVTDLNRIPLRFKPDPTLGYTKIPAQPNGDKPKNGSTVAAVNTFSAATIDFVKKGIRAGDDIVIDYVPVRGSVLITDPMPGLALMNLRFSLDNQPDNMVTFINDVGTPGAISREGVSSQINSAVGQDICSIVEPAVGLFYLEFNPIVSLKVRAQPGNPTEANTILGFSNIIDTNNTSANAGKYKISQVGVPTINDLQIDPVLFPAGFTDTLTNQQFKIVRNGAQRIASTTMSQQLAEAGLYFWDVELVSDGAGDLWNIDRDQVLTIENYRSDGYFLGTDDASLSMSPFESLKLYLSKSILEVGVDDDPDNASQLSGQSLNIAYEYSRVVNNLQSTITSEIERVVNQSPLARFLVPHFVRLDLTYAGGSKEVEIQPDVEKYIKDLLPDQTLESSDLQKILSDRGADSIDNPVDLVAIVHGFDRSISVARSQGGLTTGRLAAFIPDVIKLKRKL